MGIIQNYINPELGKEFKDANGNLKLKSLKFNKFGDDKFTSQPFIQTPIPSDDKVVTKPATPLAAYADGVVRGALISVQRSARDVERLTKYMATPSGVQFALKQNLLSRISPGTETSGFFNEGIYTPLSTLAQAGVGVLGIHLNKQGLLAGIGQTKYISQVYTNNSGNSSNNRLVALSNRVTNKEIPGFKLNPSSDTILRYGGGPGSILGIGYTKIRYATGNDGETLLKLMGANGLDENRYLTPKKISTYVQTNGTSLSDNLPGRKVKNLLSYRSSINDRLKNAGSGRQIVDTLDFTSTNPLDLSPKISGYTDYSSAVTINVDKASSAANAENKYIPLNAQTGSYLANIDKNVGYYPGPDGKMVFGPVNLNGAAKGIGPDFRKVNRIVRGFVDYSGSYDYTTKTSDDVITDGDYYKNDNRLVDQIYYTSDNKRTSTNFGADKDLITFRIVIIDPTDPSNQKPETLTFRAYIDNISDNYSPDWSSQTYMGRGEKFYKYNSFDRKISLGFTVAAEGAHHIDKMYSHLNQLASSLAPTYTTQGYMAGNIHKLTVGNYINAQYGIINGLTYEIMEESPWDIEKGKQLPMYIKVTGFQFTPIHNFRPEYKPSNGSPKFISQNIISQAAINKA